jgi:hypothetical protein
MATFVWWIGISLVTESYISFSIQCFSTLVPGGIIVPVVNAKALTFFAEYVSLNTFFLLGLFIFSDVPR